MPFTDSTLRHNWQVIAAGGWSGWQSLGGANAGCVPLGGPSIRNGFERFPTVERSMRQRFRPHVSAIILSRCRPSVCFLRFFAGAYGPRVPAPYFARYRQGAPANSRARGAAVRRIQKVSIFPQRFLVTVASIDQKSSGCPSAKAQPHSVLP